MVNSSELDLQLAIQLQEQFEEELRQQKSKLQTPGARQSAANTGVSASPKPEVPLSVSLVDPVWELVDPVPDVHALFCTYNEQFFWGKLLSVSVSWSPRMTLCAGVCSYERRGGLCSIRLSVPLLKLRPRSDLIETLLHEMIHAYLFVTANNRDRDGHGPEFHKHMHRINSRAGTKISVYHTFHDEVAVYKQHVWQCSGPCRQRRPYYGLVKRSMNRAPGPNDRWWAEHARMCGGTYTKINEPEGFGTKGVKRKATSAVNGAERKRKPNSFSNQDIRQFITGAGNSNGPTIPPGSERGFVSKKFPEKDSSHKPISKPAGTGSNIRGFGSTSSGSVLAVEVGNASRSNIVGFNKGLNKGSSINKKNADGKTSNSKKGVGSGGGHGGGVLLGGGGTLVLNPRTKTKTETTVENEAGSEVRSNVSGRGHVLGDRSAEPRLPAATSSNGASGDRPGRPVSRLLVEYDAAAAVRKSKSQQSTNFGLQTSDATTARVKAVASSHSSSSTFNAMASNSGTPSQASRLSECSVNNNRPPKNNVEYSLSDSDESDEEDNGDKFCPICERSIPSNEFLTHISVCMGDWDDHVSLDATDLTLVSALKNLDAINERLPMPSSSHSNELNATSAGDPRDEETVSPAVSRSVQSASLEAPNTSNSNSRFSNGVFSSQNFSENVSKASRYDDSVVYVSDSGDEFDDKYWKKPVVSVVQLAQDIGRPGADMASGGERSTAQPPSSNNDSSVSTESRAGPSATVPCPVCGELFTEVYITTTHINTHFD